MQTQERTLKRNSTLANGGGLLNRYSHSAIRSISLLFALPFAMAISGGAVAEADGPDYWQVTGVASGSGVNLRLGPATGFRSISRIPAGSEGLQNLGCTPAMGIGEYQRLNRSEQQLLKKLSWCRVDWQGQQGWVSASFLREGSGEYGGGASAAVYSAPAESRRRPGHDR